MRLEYHLQKLAKDYLKYMTERQNKKQKETMRSVLAGYYKELKEAFKLNLE